MLTLCWPVLPPLNTLWVQLHPSKVLPFDPSLLYLFSHDMTTTILLPKIWKSLSEGTLQKLPLHQHDPRPAPPDPLMIFAVAYTGRIRCSLACLESFQVSKDGIKLDQIWERHISPFVRSQHFVNDFLAGIDGLLQVCGGLCSPSSQDSVLCFIKIQEFSCCEHVDEFCVSMGTVLPSLVKFSRGPLVGHLRRICRTCQMRCLRQICPSSSMRSKFVRKALQQARYVMMVPM